MNYVYIILRSVLLMILVSLITLFIALPLAWINVRAALPMPNVWAVLLSLPLVIPTYVGAFLYSSILGPRGILQELLESIFGIKEIPDIHGLFGATLVLSLLSKVKSPTRLLSKLRFLSTIIKVLRFKFEK